VLSIGEFSQATRLTVKTLRFYHELGILAPVRVDEMTGYRYYDESSYDRAAGIIVLKDLGFSLNEIKTILAECDAEEDLHRFIRKKLGEIRSRVETLKQIEARLSDFEERLHNAPLAAADSIEETTLSIPCYAAVPVRGTYDRIGDGFRQLYRKAGRYGTGQPYGFYYDIEYREGDASMEAVIELRREVRIEGVECRRMEGRRAVKTLYQGPYGGQGSAYIRLFKYCHEKGYAPVPPIIEHYLKGPGLILKGNPQSYITECLLLVDPS
jgi:DNA-binding transcriptional MerR regulator